MKKNKKMKIKEKPRMENEYPDLTQDFQLYAKQKESRSAKEGIRSGRGGESSFFF